MGSPNKLKPHYRFIAIEEESFALRHQLTKAEKLVTHLNADMDALLSLVLAQIFRKINGLSELPVEFVPGGVQNFPTDTLALDIGPDRGLRSTPQGGMMLKASAAGGSCCMALLRTLPDEECAILKALVWEISKSDEDGRNASFRALDELYEEMIRARPKDTQLHDTMRSVLRSKKSGLFCTSIYDQLHSLKASGQTDEYLYNLFYDWVVGILVRGRGRRRLKLVDHSFNTRMMFNGRLAILEIGSTIPDSHKAQENGAELSLYCGMLQNNPLNWSMSLCRARGAHINLEDLFRDRMDDFPTLAIRPFLVGWTNKGGGIWVENKNQIEAFRERFIERVIMVLEPWMLSPRH